MHWTRIHLAAALALVVALAGCTSTPVSSEATASPSDAFAEMFASPLHGLSIGYPSGWRTRPATEPWARGAVDFGAPDVDIIFDPTLQDNLYFALVSEPLDATSAPGWVTGIQFPSVGICTEPIVGGAWGTFPVAGADGWAASCDSHAAGGHVVAVATATRGYIIYLHVGDDPLLQTTYDWDWFEAALQTVDLRPEDALDD